MVKKTEIDGKIWFAVERFKMVVAAILLAGSLAIGVSSYFVNTYRLDQVEGYVSYVDADLERYVEKDVLELKLDNIVLKLDNLEKQLVRIEKK